VDKKLNEKKQPPATHTHTYTVNETKKREDKLRRAETYPTGKIPTDGDTM